MPINNPNDVRLSKQGSVGTSNGGYEYEINLPALFSLNLFEDLSVEDFELSVNVKNFGKFDDLLVTKKTNKITENYAFQLKYKDEANRTIQIKALEQSKHFAIKTYCKSYYVDLSQKDNYKFILYTNAYLAKEIPDAVGVFNIKESDDFSGKKNFFKPFDVDENKAKIYTFSVRDNTFFDEVPEDVCKIFFENFAFVTYQQDWNEVQHSITEIFKTIYGLDETVALKFITFFRELKHQKFTNVVVTKEDLKIKMLDLVLSPYILAPTTNPKNNRSIKFRLFKKAIKKFDVVLFNENNEEILQNLSSDDYITEDDESLLKLAKDLKFCTRKQDFSDRDLKTQVKYKIGYYKKGQPIIVKVNESNKKSVTSIINKVKKDGDQMCFILNGKQVKKQDFSSLEVFESLYDLFNTDQNLFRQIIEKCKITLLNNTYTYEELFGMDYEVLKKVTVKDIYEMLEGNFIIEVDSENLPHPYIRRTVSTTLFDTELLKTILNEYLVISCKNHPEVLNQIKQISDKTVLNIDKYLHDQDTISASELIIISEDRITEEAWFQICQKNETKNIHCFEVMNEKFLRWTLSKGSIKLLKKCEFKSKPYTKENNIFKKFRNKLNLLVAQPGMGKSEMFRNMKNTCPVGFFPLLIHFKEHIEFFNSQHTVEDVLNHFINVSSENFFKKKAIDVFVDKKKIIFFLDGLDELYLDQLNKVIDHVQQILSLGFSIWISSRPNLREKIEDKFNVFSINIENFTEDEQKKYIDLRLRGHNRNTNQIIQGILKTITTTIGNCDILGIPLQLFMITEAFIQKPDVSEIHMFILTNMFKDFIDGKYNHYLKERGCFHSLEKIINDSKIYRTAQYGIAALKCCFSRSELKSLAVKNDDKFLTQIRQEGDFLGIISSIKTNVAVFNHNINAEYFAALWFTENRNEKFLKTILFNEKYRNIKVMFDMILAEDSPAHIAILHKNVDELKKYRDKIVLSDRGGRTTLHLVCSHICKYPNVDKLGEMESLDMINSLREHDAKYREMLKILFEFENDLLKPDDIFKWNSLMYLDQSFFLLPLDLFLEKDNTLNIFELNMVKYYKKKILYYSAFFTYNNIFKKLFSLDIFSRQEMENLLHLAAAGDNWEVAKILLDNKVDVHCKRAVDERTPLHLAALHGHVRTLVVLLVKQADVKSIDQYGKTPLHLAAAEGHVKTILELEKEGAEINVVDRFGKTPLHLAVERGQIEAVKFLLDKSDINRVLRNGWSPLHVAVFEGHAEIVRLLLEKNALFDKYDAFGNKPLHLAVKRCNVESIKMLLERSLEVDDRTLDGKTCLHLAAEFGHVEVVEFLLEKGANVKAVDNIGKMAVHWAATEGHVEVIKILERKIEVDQKDESGRTALQYATEFGHFDTVSWLIENNADVNSKADDGSTALHWAAKKGYNNIVKFLLEKGADINAVDDTYQMIPTNGNDT